MVSLPAGQEENVSCPPLESMVLLIILDPNYTG